MNSSTLPRRTLRKRAESPADWTPSLAPAWVRRLRSLGTQIRHPLPIDIAEETKLCEESMLEHNEIFLKISALVSRCSEKL